MTTAGDTRGIVTASTESMLTTRLRAELRKWFRLFRGQTFFELTSTALISRDVAHEQTWRFTRPPHRGGGRTYNFATSKKGSAPFHRSSFEMRCTVPVRSRATWPPSRYPDPSQVASAPSARSHCLCLADRECAALWGITWPARGGCHERSPERFLLL